MPSYKINNCCNCGSLICISCQEIASEPFTSIKNIAVTSQDSFMPDTDASEGLQVVTTPFQVETDHPLTQDPLEVAPTLPESKACIAVLKIVHLKWVNSYNQSQGKPVKYPEADNIVVPERVRQMVESKRAPRWGYQMQIADRISTGELAHGDLIFTAHAVSMIDTRTVPGCVYPCLFDRDEVLDFLRFQNMKRPRYGKPARLTEDQKFWFKVRFNGVPL